METLFMFVIILQNATSVGSLGSNGLVAEQFRSACQSRGGTFVVREVGKKYGCGFSLEQNAKAFKALWTKS